MIRCTAPGKIMLAGEYAVIDGSFAIMLAVDRYAVATIQDSPQHLSPFLTAVHRVMCTRFGDQSQEAFAALRVRVDTRSFRENREKLGLGSSAAATVAAVGAALGDAFDVETVHKLARQAHGDAQEAKGTRGSGADVASSCYGSCLRFSTAPSQQAVTLPPDLHLVFPWCGQSASTTALVPKVRLLRTSARDNYERLCQAIVKSAQGLASASEGASAVSALRAGGQAVAELGRAAGVDLWLPIHSQMQDIAAQLGGAVKPTGAGGGDLALAAFSSAEAATLFEARLGDHGIHCPALAPSHQGVRLLGQTSKVGE
ncbi:MAG: hypothetical protein GY811_05850 [Myxococcales bacterium]|nr:hypothetical protein [Myxococcales bacterium]